MARRREAHGAAGQARPVEVGVAKVCPLKNTIVQLRAAKRCALELHPFQRGARKVGLIKDRAGEIAAIEHDSLQLAEAVEVGIR